MRANRYVSYLGAEIEPKALSNLSRFEAATEATFDKLERLSTRGPSALGLGGGFSPTARRSMDQQAVAAKRVSTEMGTLSAATRKVAADTSLAATSFTRAAQALNVVQGPLGPLAGRLGALGGVLRDLTGLSLAGVLGGGGAFALGSIATSYQQITDRLRPFYDGQQALNGAMNDVIGIAARTRQALDPVAELYTKITQSARDAGIQQERIAKITETVAKAAKLSGGTQQAQEAGIQQFTQGFGSGTFAGDELKSVRENTSRLAKAIADGLDVPVSKLKELGSQGLLTQKVLDQALSNSAATIDAEFEKVGPRIGSSLTAAGNNLTVFIGKMDELAGATTGLAKGILLFGDNIPTVVAGLGTLAVAMSAKGITGYVNNIATAISRNFDFNRSLKDTTGILNNKAAIEYALSQRTAQRAAAELSGAQAARGAAAEASAASRTALANSKAYVAQLEAQISAIQRQTVAQRAAVATANSLAAARGTAIGGASVGATPAQIQANTELARTNLLRTQTERQLALAVAEVDLAETKLRGTLNSQIAAMGAAEVARVQLLATNRALAISDAAWGASMARTTVLQRGATLASELFTKALTGVRAGVSALIGALGGGLGAALTLAAGAMFFLSTRTDDALDALNNFSGGQEALAKKLGITTDQLRTQTGAARDLAAALAEANVLKAKQKQLAAGDDLGAGLREASFRIGSRGSARDRSLLLDIADRAERGKLEAQDTQRLIQIQKRNAEAFKKGGSSNTPADLLGNMLGTDPSESIKRVLGFAAATEELTVAQKEQADVQKELAKPRIKVDLGTPRTKAQVEADIKAEVAGTNQLKKLRAERAKLKADFDAGTIDTSDYTTRAVELDRSIQGIVASEKASRAATVASNKAKREAAAASKAQEVADNKAAGAAEKLADIMGRYDENPRAIDKANDDKRALRALVGKRIDPNDRTSTFTERDYNSGASKIDQQVRKPAADALRDQERELSILRLTIAGRADEAEVLRQKFQLIDSIGDVTADEEAKWRANNDAIYAGNRALEQRQQIIDVYANLIGDIQQSTTTFIKDLLGGKLSKGFSGLYKNLRDSFINSKANELSIKLFGDPQQKFRDEMTRGLNDSGARLMTSGEKLIAAASDLSSAASAVSALGGGGTLGTAFGSPLETSSPLPVLADLATASADAFDAINGRNGTKFGPQDDGPSNDNEIVVTAAKAAGAVAKITGVQDKIPTGTTAVFNKTAKDLVGALAGKNSPLAAVAGKLGTFMEGAGYGSLAGSIAKGIGVKTSATGSAIGGGLGQLAATGISSIAKSLGSAAGPLGAIAGGLIGGVVGGLFKKTKYASSTVTSVDGSNVVTGNSTSAKGTAGGLGENVQDGVRRIAEALGGDTSGFAVSIGTRKGNFRVDPTGGGATKVKKGAVDFGKDAEAATKFAILDAISDGAVKGIRAGALRLLQAGKDLDTSLEKALRFDKVFTDLDSYLDPVGASVRSLNKEFESLKKLFGEAGASAEEYAQLEQLYGIKREEAIKQASSGALQAIQDFISGMTASGDSPLDRRTVYNNAKGEADVVAGKINSGQRITEDDLKKLEQFDDASRQLYGSRDAYFKDFDAILALAKKAEQTYTGSTTTLPGSPFDAQMQATLKSQLDTQLQQTTYLSTIARALENPAYALVKGNSQSSIDKLASYK